MATDETEKVTHWGALDIAPVQPVEVVTRSQGTVQVLMEMLDLAVQYLNVPDPRDAAAAKRDADALAHAIRILQGRFGEGSVWEELLAQEIRNKEYYQSVLVEIGTLIGKDAYVSDDGSVQDQVLVAKLPDLVRELVKS